MSQPAPVLDSGRARHGPRCPGDSSTSGGDPGSGARIPAGAGSGARLRRLPHRPPCRGRRAAESEAPARPRPPVVGTVVEAAGAASTLAGPATRVGIPWLGWTCGAAASVSAGGRTSARSAGSPDTTSTADSQRWRSPTSATAFPFPDGYPDIQAAPLLCAGLIGYRAYRMTGDARRDWVLRLRRGGAHLIQVAIHQGRTVHAFTRPGDIAEPVVRPRPWARPGPGTPTEPRPSRCDAAHHLRPGGRAGSARARAPSSRGAWWSAPGST